MKKFSTHSIIVISLFIIINISNKAYSQEVYHATAVNFLEAAKYEKLHPVKQKTGHKVAELNMQDVPGNLPIPNGAIIKKFITPASNNPDNAVSATPQLMQVSPAPTNSFLAASDNGSSIPPDGGGAVGPNHVFATENHVFTIRDKTGVLISSVSPQTFFSAISPAFSGDPHIKYDQYSQRWIIVGQTDITATSSIEIAVSQTNDPTGTYNKYAIKIDPISAQVADFPLLGFNKKWIVITTNLFNLAGSAFTGTSLLVFDKSVLYAGENLDFSTNAFRQLNASPEGANPCPTVTFSTGASGDDMALLQTWNSEAGTLRLSKVTGDLPNLSWPANVIFMQLPFGWTFNGGEIAPQPDDTNKIDAGDARMQTLIERNGLLWACHTIFVNERSLVQWLQFTPAGNIVQASVINAGASTVFRAYPSLAVTPDESVLIGYSRFSTSAYASAAYSYRNGNTPYNSLDDEVVYKDGLSSYYKTFGGTRNRWGDFSSCAVDPVTGRLWTKQEIADQRVGPADNDSRYATWWAEVTPTIAINNVDASISAINNPVAATTYCDSIVTSKITLRNAGADTLRNAIIQTTLDGVVIDTYNFTGTLASLASEDIALPSFNATTGFHTLKISVINPNGVADQRNNNDAVTITFTILQTLILPRTEGFESPGFPPPGGWALQNNDGDVTWMRTTDAAKTGIASMRIDGYDYGPGSATAVDIFTSPVINIKPLDSVNVSFDVAYAKYDNVFADTLEIVYSKDCGQSWLPTGYKKWGDALVTNGGNQVQDSMYIPAISEWRRDNVSLNICDINADNILIGVKFINFFGQACYIDNLTISSSELKQSNAAIMSINKPSDLLCDPAFPPEVTLINRGSDTLKTLTINYQVDNGPLSVFNFTGSIARCSTQIITLNPITSPSGNHILTIYTTNPNGAVDQSAANDTLRKQIIISPVLEAPVAEGFESPEFPPANWAVSNPDGLLSWERTTTTAKTGVASMVIRNFDYPVENVIDKLLSPIIKTSNADSIFVSFDYAYRPGAQYPGSTAFPLDTLEVQVTQDCGQTFTSVFKKWGEELQTVNNPNFSSPSRYVPAINDWQNIRLYLSPFVASQNFQVYFVAKSNKQNNLYLDNININTVTLPQRLKTQGYLIYPNPFSGSFIVRNLQVPTLLKTIGVYNSVGQLVWQNQLNGTGNTEITVNLGKLSAGVYIVKLDYTNKTVVERIVKAQ